MSPVILPKTVNQSGAVLGGTAQLGENYSYTQGAFGRVTIYCACHLSPSQVSSCFLASLLSEAANPMSASAHRLHPRTLLSLGFHANLGSIPAAAAAGWLSCGTLVQCHSSWTCSRSLQVWVFHSFIYGFLFVSFFYVSSPSPHLCLKVHFNLMLKFLAPVHRGLFIPVTEQPAPKQFPHRLTILK